MFKKNCIAQYYGSNFHNFYNSQNKIFQKHITFSLSKLSKLLILGKSIKWIFDDLYKGDIGILYIGININYFERVEKKLKNDNFLELKI